MEPLSHWLPIPTRYPKNKPADASDLAPYCQSMRTNLPPRPTSDQTTLLLAPIMEDYQWKDFKPLLYSPEKLQNWILEKLRPEPEALMLHPDDPMAAELSMLAMDSEDKALEFWGELTKEEREMFREAFRALWGPKGAGPLPG